MADEATGGAAAADATATTATAGNVLADGAAAADAAKTSAAADAKATETKAAGDAATGADGKAAEAKADGKDGKATDAPIEYTDFTMPEGVQVDDATLGEAKALLSGMKLPQDQAQQLVDFYAGKIKAFGEAQTNNWVKLNEKWVGEFKADKEIGGDRATDTISAAAKAMDRFGTPGLREALIMTGAGNHPEIIRFVARVGKAISEDSFVVASGGSGGGSRSAAEVLYPDQNKGG